MRTNFASFSKLHQFMGMKLHHCHQYTYPSVQPLYYTVKKFFKTPEHVTIKWYPVNYNSPKKFMMLPNSPHYYGNYSKEIYSLQQFVETLSFCNLPNSLETVCMSMYIHLFIHFHYRPYHLLAKWQSSNKLSLREYSVAFL